MPERQWQSRLQHNDLQKKQPFCFETRQVYLLVPLKKKLTINCRSYPLQSYLAFNFVLSANYVTMIRKTIASLLLVLSVLGISYAQKLKKADKAVIANLQAHVSFLADDKLEGRRAGSSGEKLAMQYIAAQFEKAGLQPKGDSNWFQPFEINDGKDIGKSCYLFINGGEIKAADFFPLMGSPDKLIEAAPSIALRETGLPWFLDLKEALELNKENPHFDVKAFILDQVKNAAKKNASSLIIYNSGTADDGLKFDPKEKAAPLIIPVVYVQKSIAKKYFSDVSATIDIKLRTVFEDKKRTGHNIIGYIDNGAATAIIAGAHFDHLGYGEDNNSMYRGTEKRLH
jgi:aminopeptidase YwaD